MPGMSVLVVVQRQARPGQIGALLARMRARWNSPDEWHPGRRQVRLLQSAHMPDRLLLLAEWESVQAYREHRARHPADDVNALSVEPDAARLFVREWLFEAMGQRPHIVNAVTYHVPAHQVAGTRQFLDEVIKPAVRGLPGLLLHALYADPGDPTQLLTIDGWSSEAALTRMQTELGPRFRASIRARGVVVERFIGLPRADLDRWQT
jgi:quinol monooxygenase YgiN